MTPAPGFETGDTVRILEGPSLERRQVDGVR